MIQTRRPLRIAVLAPLDWRVPPRHYGPWELVASHLAEGLTERGHEVTLFATADAQTSARLIAVCPRPLNEDPLLDRKVYEHWHLSEVFERAGEFDVIHNNFDFMPLTYSQLTPTPVVTTIHGFSDTRILPIYEKYQNTSQYVSISLASRHPSLRYAGNVYHGMVVEEFPFVEHPEQYLLFFGRIHPDKGVHDAIELAEKMGERLIIAGIIQDEKYFTEVIQPKLSSQIQYVGPVGGDNKLTLLSQAKLLLQLIHFDEPFGLSMIEAMACGTPVLANRRGSIPEVIEPSISGEIVAESEISPSAAQRCFALSRTKVRQYVQQKFSREQMITGYEAIYQKILV